MTKVDVAWILGTAIFSSGITLVLGWLVSPAAAWFGPPVGIVLGIIVGRWRASV